MANSAREPDMQTHFGDPCIHCGLTLDQFQVGACTGDPAKAKPIAYRSLGVRWDGVECFLIRMSTNEVRERWSHVSEWAPSRGFNMLGDLQQKPRYDPRLTRPKATEGAP
jgi:hypothetical protein